jgi:hypothetical protein
MKKHRTTVFTRLLIFLLVFTPLAYVGVNYAKGKNPLTELKTLFGVKQNMQEQNTRDVPYKSKSKEELTIELQRTEIENLKKELEACKQAN